MNWDDLRILEAVSHAGSYAGASTRLRLDETTVSRRLARLQTALGVTLFDLVDGERRPTPACAAMLAHVQAMARHAAEIGSAGKTVAGPTGRFRIAATSTIAETVLAPRAAHLLASHPGLTLHFLISSENVNLSKWEADFAIRLRKPDKGDFAISKLADLRMYLIEPLAPDPQAPPILCAYPDTLAGTPEARILRARYGENPARCITDNVRVIRALLASRRAIGVLPETLLGDLPRDPHLKVSLLDSRREVWLLIQNHLKRDAAARLVISFIRDCFSDLGKA